MSQGFENLIANIQQKLDEELDKPFNMENVPDHQNNPQVIIVEKQNTQNLSKAIDKVDDDEKHEKEVNQSIEQYDDEYRQENYEEDDENKYKSISSKLQSALKKISSSKKIFQTMNHSKSASMFNRFQDFQKKKQKDLANKRKDQQQKKQLYNKFRCQGLSFKPEINAKSQRIALQTSYKPIYERCDGIIEQKKRKELQHIQRKKEKEQKEYEQYLNGQHSKIDPQACRDSESYFQDMMNWKQKLDRENEQKLKEKQQKQKQGYTFKPIINEKSIRMLKNIKRVPIHQREIQRPKTQRSEYTFQPKINKKK